MDEGSSIPRREIAGKFSNFYYPLRPLDATDDWFLMHIWRDLAESFPNIFKKIPTD
jgi:hypothetical protein